VHDEILNDLVYPTEIVGKRIRYRVDGSKVLKVRHKDRVAEGCDRELGLGLLKAVTDS
jgi:small subunit ribosomal protein S7e